MESSQTPFFKIKNVRTRVWINNGKREATCMKPCSLQLTMRQQQYQHGTRGTQVRAHKILSPHLDSLERAVPVVE